MSFRGAANLRFLLIAALVLGAASGAHAAPRTSIEFSTITLVQPGAPATTYLRGLLHLNAQYLFGPTVFTLSLDPGLLLNGPTQASWGLTEAYVQHRRGRVELRLGVERIPLETARLMLPFSIEPLDMLGTRLGRSGVRLLWNPDTATRIRFALLEDTGAFLPALSIRRQFSSFEMEGHALAFSGGRTAFAVGGSGLVERLVVYGEVWALTAPAEWRYAVGVSGSIRNGMWTVEAGYAADAPSRLGSATLTRPRPQAVGQIAYRVSEEVTLTGTGRLFADPDALRSQLTLQLTRTAGNADYSVTLSLLPGQPQQGIVITTVSYSF